MVERKEAPKDTKDTIETIAARAYEIYIQRGGENGKDVEDWIQAEHELIANTK
jgi:hypothetical protein